MAPYGRKVQAGAALPFLTRLSRRVVQTQAMRAVASRRAQDLIIRALGGRRAQAIRTGRPHGISGETERLKVNAVIACIYMVPGPLFFLCLRFSRCLSGVQGGPAISRASPKQHLPASELCGVRALAGAVMTGGIERGRPRRQGARQHLARPHSSARDRANVLTDAQSLGCPISTSSIRPPSVDGSGPESPRCTENIRHPRFSWLIICCLALYYSWPRTSSTTTRSACTAPSTT